MDPNIKNELCIINSNLACVSHLSDGYLRKVYLNSLFSNIFKHTEVVIVWLWSPFMGFDNLTNQLSDFRDYLRLLNIDEIDKYTQLPAVLSYSFTKSHDKSINQQFINLLVSSWIAYDHNEVYFFTNLLNIDNKEDIIIRRKQRIVNINALESYIFCDQSHSDEDIKIHKRFELSFDHLFTSDPAVEVQTFLNNRGLYKIPYSEEILKSREIIDSILQEFGLKKTFENPDFLIDDNSSVDKLVFDIQNKGAAFIQIELSKNDINLNIDRVHLAICIKQDNINQVHRFISIILFSKIRVYHIGNYQTKIFFLDKNDSIIETISRRFLPIISIFSKKEIFDYKPLYQLNL